MRVLDLCCCAGGASDGITAAGHTVHGLDIAPQPNYPYPFTCGDVLTCDLGSYDAYFASPPCQAFTNAAYMRLDARSRRHPRIIEDVRARLVATGKPFVIENVLQAPIRHDLVLDGSMFGLAVIRRRAFEIHGGFVMQPGTRRGELRLGVNAVPVYGSGGGLACRYGVAYAPTASRIAAMGITRRMSRYEVNQAIPPAYTRYIFERLFV